MLYFLFLKIFISKEMNILYLVYEECFYFSIYVMKL